MQLRSVKALPTFLFLGLSSLAATATTIVSSFGDISATDNDNQAGPIRGVSYLITTVATYTNPTVTQGGSGNINPYTATHTLSATDSGATQIQFQSLTWQRSSSTAMTGTFYVAIMDGFTVDSSGTVTNVGTVMGVSSNSITTPSANAAMSWTFGDVLLSVGSTYQFVFTNTATPTVASHFVSGQLELKTGTNLLAETQLVAGNAAGFTNRAGWEPVFSMTYNSVPEPAAVLFGSLGLLTILRRRRY